MTLRSILGLMAVLAMFAWIVADRAEAHDPSACPVCPVCVAANAPPPEVQAAIDAAKAAITKAKE